MSQNAAPVWLITGCSTGFGREIARVALERGARVVVTARDISRIDDFRSLDPDKVLTLPLDIVDSTQIGDVVARARERFGRIDVLVNNAGRGYLAAIEEGEEAGVKALFDVNFFGLMAMTNAVLPIMREQKSGCVVNISSVGGLRATAGHGYYAASKFAVEGFSEALALEMEPFGVRVLIVEPGPFRTAFFDPKSIVTAKEPIDAYASRSVGAHNPKLLAFDRKQPGDPRRGAELIVKAVEAKSTLRLVLGNQAIDAARAKLNAVAADIDAWEADSRATAFPT